MTKQHHKPCGTCPFTKDFAPDLSPGGSPLAVYVAQHFMPFRVPCHECVDYETNPENWKPNALETSECVGFAQCRNGRGVDVCTPDALLKEDYDPEGNAFKDIWEFWAYHKQIGRIDALLELRPDTILSMCREELQRAGKIDIKGDTSSQDAAWSLLKLAMRLATNTWLDAIQEEFKGLEDRAELAEAKFDAACKAVDRIGTRK